MANVKINDLGIAGAVSDTMQLETDIGGVTANKITALQTKDYVNAGKTGGKTIEGGTLTAQTLTAHNNATDQLGFTVDGVGDTEFDGAVTAPFLGNVNDSANSDFYIESGNTQAVAIDNTPDTQAGFNTGAPMYQSFTATKNMEMSAFSIDSNISGGGGLLEIRSGEGYLGAILHTNASYGVTATGENIYSLPSNISLTNGQQYSIIWDASGANFEFRRTVTPYAGGKYDINGTEQGDLRFKIYEDAATVVKIDSTTGDFTGTTQSAGDNSTKFATTEYADNAVLLEDLWDRVTGATNYLITKNVGDWLDIKTGGIRFGDGTDTDYTALEYNNTNTTKPFLEFSSIIAGQAATSGLHLYVQDAVKNAGLHTESETYIASNIISTRASGIGIEPFLAIGQLSTGILTSGTRRLWRFDYNTGSEYLTVRKTTDTSITDVMQFQNPDEVEQNYSVGFYSGGIQVYANNNSGINFEGIDFDTDLFPTSQIAGTHDSIALSFDAYWFKDAVDAEFRSGDAGSNGQIIKTGDELKIRYDSGIAQGSPITWNDALSVNLTTGALTIANAFTLPVADGSPNQVLKTDGAGVVTWQIDSTAVAWGGITGTLSNQSDLQNALNAKQDSLTNGVDALTSGEVTQLANIDSNVISNAEWGFLAAMNQGVATTDSTSFAGLTVADDTDATTILGRAKLFSDNSDFAAFAHYDHATSGNLALTQSNAGGTRLNSATGQSIFFTINNSIKASINNAGTFIFENDIYYDGTDLQIRREAAGTTTLDLLGSGNNGAVYKLTHGNDANANTTLTQNATTTSLAFGSSVTVFNIGGDTTITGSLGATGSRVTKGWFTDLEITNMPTVSGTSINANGVLSLTSAEVTQLANIDSTTISTTQWGYLGAMNQGVATTNSPTFVNVNLTVNTDDVSNPPTDAELDAIFGAPATVGAGFTAYIDDNGGGTNFYHISTNGASWFYTMMAKAV